jgi:hypothetical protein
LKGFQAKQEGSEAFDKQNAPLEVFFKRQSSKGKRRTDKSQDCYNSLFLSHKGYSALMKSLVNKAVSARTQKYINIGGFEAIIPSIV